MRRPPLSPGDPPRRPSRRPAAALLLTAAALAVWGGWRALEGQPAPPAPTAARPRPAAPADPALFLTRDSPLGARLLPPPGRPPSRPPPTAGGAGLAAALDWRDVRDPPPPPRPHRACPAAGCPSTYDVPTAGDGGGACPVPAPARTVDDARAGVHPYLLGGRPPACSNCALPSDEWASFCAFDGGPPACPGDVVDDLVAGLVARTDAGSAAARAALTLAPCDVWPVVEGRAVWVVGDNEAMEFARALACFFLEFWDTATKTVAPWAEGGAPDEPLPASSLAAVGGWCVYLPRGARLCYVAAPDLPTLTDVVLPAFAAGDGRLTGDVLVASAGVHYTEEAHYRERLAALASTIRRLTPARLPRLLWRDAAPQHFKTGDGQWADSVPDGCGPLPGVGAAVGADGGDRLTLDADAAAAEAAARADPGAAPLPPSRGPASLLTGGWRGAAVDAELGGLAAAGAVTRVSVWNATATLLPDPGRLYATYHPPGAAYVDCSHPCHPSTYQAWIVAVAEALK